MNADTFDACVEGYSDHLFDLQLLTVQCGFWSGYYGFGSKRPKTPDRIAESMIQAKTGSQKREHCNEVDVEQFLRMEQSFQSRLRKEEENG